MHRWVRNNKMVLNKQVGRDRTVDIGTHYGLHDPRGRIPVAARFFHSFRPTLTPVKLVSGHNLVIISWVKRQESGLYCPSQPSSGVKEVRGPYFNPLPPRS